MIRATGRAVAAAAIVLAWAHPASAQEQRPNGEAGPPTVAAPAASERPTDFQPLPDRWRIEFPEWERVPGSSAEQPYQRGSILDPYDQNVLKGDYPIFGNDWFSVLKLENDTLVEGRAIPIPSGVSTASPDSQQFFGSFHQFLYNQNWVVSEELFKGDTAFKPKDLAIRLTPVFNVNYLKLFERNVVNVDVRDGTDRLDGHVGLQEAFVEAHLFDLSPNYDTLTLIAGIQHFQSDFRGFLFSDNNMGVRLVGNYLSNRLQLNLAWFHQLEKDTNSGLNDYEFRNQNIFIANMFLQDFLSELTDSFLGYTFLVSWHMNLDLSGTHYDKNGFLVRPAEFGYSADASGNFRSDGIRVHYLGFGGDGHIGPVNLTHQYYLALGRESANPLSQRPEDVLAHFFAAEASVDVDWLRFKASFLYASGDKNPGSGRATGFDTILDNPFFAGAGFSYWNRQSIPLDSTSVSLKGRLSILPDLRSSKIEGKASFVNPGLYLYNVGASAKLTPKLFLDANVNFLFFDQTTALENVLFQSQIGKWIGVDYSLGVQYRPLLTDNVIITVGAGALTPGSAFRRIYSGETLYSGFTALTFTY